MGTPEDTAVQHARQLDIQSIVDATRTRCCESTMLIDCPTAIFSLSSFDGRVETRPYMTLACATPESIPISPGSLASVPAC